MTSLVALSTGSNLFPDFPSMGGLALLAHRHLATAVRSALIASEMRPAIYYEVVVEIYFIATQNWGAYYRKKVGEIVQVRIQPYVQESQGKSEEEQAAIMNRMMADFDKRDPRLLRFVKNQPQSIVGRDALKDQIEKPTEQSVTQKPIFLEAVAGRFGPALGLLASVAALMGCLGVGFLWVQDSSADVRTALIGSPANNFQDGISTKVAILQRTIVGTEEAQYQDGMARQLKAVQEQQAEMNAKLDKLLDDRGLSASHNGSSTQSTTTSAPPIP